MRRLLTLLCLCVLNSLRCCCLLVFKLLKERKVIVDYQGHLKFQVDSLCLCTYVPKKLKSRQIRSMAFCFWCRLRVELWHLHFEGKPQLYKYDLMDNFIVILWASCWCFLMFMYPESDERWYRQSGRKRRERRIRWRVLWPSLWRSRSWTTRRARTSCKITLKT